jgi:hypothetical protein
MTSRQFQKRQAGNPFDHSEGRAATFHKTAIFAYGILVLRSMGLGAESKRLSGAIESLSSGAAPHGGGTSKLRQSLIVVAGKTTDMKASSAVSALTATILLGLSAAASAQYGANLPIEPWAWQNQPPPISAWAWQNQPAPMDITPLVQNNINLYYQGQLDVARAFQLCLQLSAAIRQAGQDPGNCGETTDSLRASIDRLSQQYSANNRAATENSQRTMNAIEHKRCWQAWDQYSQTYRWYCLNQ